MNQSSFGKYDAHLTHPMNYSNKWNALYEYVIVNQQMRLQFWVFE